MLWGRPQPRPRSRCRRPRWETPIAGYRTTTGYDATTGWGTPKAPLFVAGVVAAP